MTLNHNIVYFYDENGYMLLFERFMCKNPKIISKNMNILFENPLYKRDINKSTTVEIKNALNNNVYYKSDTVSFMRLYNSEFKGEKS